MISTVLLTVAAGITSFTLDKARTLVAVVVTLEPGAQAIISLDPSVTIPGFGVTQVDSTIYFASNANGTADQHSSIGCKIAMAPGQKVYIRSATAGAYVNLCFAS